MSGRSPRWYGVAAKCFDVKLAGTTDATYAYMAIDGFRYLTAGTYQAESGATIIVHSAGSSTSGCKVTLNGTQVGTTDYSFTISTPVTITFTKKTSFITSYYLCDIVTG